MRPGRPGAHNVPRSCPVDPARLVTLCANHHQPARPLLRQGPRLNIGLPRPAHVRGKS